jgi:hypothetical protein
MGGGSPSRSNSMCDFSLWPNTDICSSVGSSRSRASYWFDVLVETWWWALTVFFFFSFLFFPLFFLRFVLACQNWKVSRYFVDVSSLNLIFLLLFVLFWIFFLLIFFFNLIPQHLVSFNFYIKFGSHFFYCYLFIFIIFLIEFVFNFIS